ncbi:protein C1orf43 homolog [Panulirus ornatus]|uniref:protein C1orf43 homolog n=1 Tax=Panulirus ornatus TaxID=150431 RepID=UPI003A84C39F
MPTAGAMTLMFIAVILFAIIFFVTCFKRQVGRMKDRSRRDPHVPGSEAKKALRREIEQRLDRVAEIYYEPKLLTLEIDTQSNNELPPYYFRMKAVDNMKYLEQQLSSLEGVGVRGQRESIRAFLMNLTNPGGVLALVEPRVIHELCDYYDHARYHPMPFTAAQFTPYHSLLLRILHCGRNGEKFSGHMTSTVKAPSDHDSAIDEPEHDHSGDDENLIITDSSMVLLNRPSSLKVSPEDNFETSV